MQITPKKTYWLHVETTKDEKSGDGDGDKELKVKEKESERRRAVVEK